MRTLVSLFLVLNPALCAQKIPDPKRPELEIQLHDVADFKLQDGEVIDVEFEAFRPVPTEFAVACRRFIQPPLADGEDVQTLGGEMLAARLRPAQHAWIHGWLKQLRADPTRQFDVTARYLELAPKDHARFLQPVLTAKAAVKGVKDDSVAWIVSRDAVEKALRAAPSLRPVEAPRVLTYELTRASISFLRNQTYVRTYSKHPTTKAWSPVIDTCQSGVAMDVRGTLLPGGSHGLTLRPTWHHLIEMKKDAEVRDGRQLPIDVPKTLEWNTEFHVSLPPGTVVVFAKAPTEKGQPHRLIVLGSREVK